jgi:hypothetical protein
MFFGRKKLPPAPQWMPVGLKIGKLLKRVLLIVEFEQE